MLWSFLSIEQSAVPFRTSCIPRKRDSELGEDDEIRHRQTQKLKERPELNVGRIAPGVHVCLHMRTRTRVCRLILV